MITVRPAAARGHFKNDWLDSRHSFSFGEYYEPQHLGFSVLRVINDDLIGAGAGFPMHGHRDMEIITYVLDGAIAHQDSLGNGSTIRPGEVQRMTAGTGIRHSEFNPAPDHPTRLLQIWLIPATRGLEPGYAQARVPDGPLVKIAGEGGAVTINQDSHVYAARLGAGQHAVVDLADKRTGWIQVARGKMTVNGIVLEEGDGAAIRRENRLELMTVSEAEALVFDLPAIVS